MEKNKQLYMIGHAHIDPVWYWQWQEGFQEIKATFRSALDRLNEYDDFIFTNSSASFYEWVEQNDPAMFEEIKEKVTEGRWVIVGGWWIEPDCNVPGGESYVRQGLYGQNYFKEKLGVKAECGFNVDSFGHNGMLPQILKKCGMDSYVFMRPGRHEKGLPEETFIWQSSDGSKVTAFRIPFEYCTWPEEIKEHIERCAGEIKNPGNGIMCFYGVGNHGGGPTKRNIDSIYELNKKEDIPELIFASPNDYFQKIKESNRELPLIFGELFHHASGCYSVHSEVKSLNRKAENRLLMAEKFSAMADIYSVGSYPLEKYTSAWKDVLFNQFHDILAGTCIEPAYEDAREGYCAALHEGAKGLNSALQSLSWQINIPMEEDVKPLVVFNPNAFSIKAEVEVESVSLKENTILIDDRGKQIPYQLVQPYASSLGRCRIVFVAELPSMGYRTYRFVVREKGELFEEVTATDDKAENQWFKITWDKETGYIKSLYKKKDGTEYFGGPAAVPVVIEDKSDTWSHAVRIFDKEIGKFQAVSVKKVESGAVKSVIRVTSEYKKSRMIQDFSIYKELDYISVKTTVDWHEKWSMLKLRFPINMNYLRATWEIPYGIAQREPNGEEFPMQNFIDVEGTNPGMDTAVNGLAILNDGKFSGSIARKEVSLTVLRSPIYAHHEPYEPDESLEYVYIDQGVQTFTYALYPHDGSFEDANTVKYAKLINQKPIPIFETYHEGKLALQGSFLQVSVENIIIETIKEAEDGSGDVILRIYETAGKDTAASIQIPILGREIQTSFTPFEIKTVRIPRKIEDKIIWTNMLEEPLEEE